MARPQDPFLPLRRRRRGRRPRRSPAPAASRASVAVVLAGRRLHDLEVLLIERIRRPRDPWSGHIAFPGGRREPSDRDRLATALREAREEAGLKLRRASLLGELDDLRPRTATYPELAVRPFVFGLTRKSKAVPGPEAARCFWVRLDSLPERACEADFLIAGKRRRLPGYRVGRHVVWGITYRILSSLLERLHV
ncbi:MAG: CoA pyrophosphatase [Elusimicrobia bacterium]|nr:CoA pyrophosphatase [Elusimicrobiota bacterium]